MRKPIHVAPYNPQWPAMFEAEATTIAKALGKNCIALHHVGSTSVPGLAAKPTIDIIGVVGDPFKTIEPLASVGFVYRGEYNIPMHFGFSKKEGVDVNLHIYEEGHPEIDLNLAFRDYLRTHTKARDDYAMLKYILLKDPASLQKNGRMFAGYTLGKDAFIRGILRQTNFNRLRITRCTHNSEWEAVTSMIQDATQHPDHIYVILYQGVDIIGCSHIQNKTVQQILYYSETKKTPDMETYFLVVIEQWLMVENNT